MSKQIEAGDSRVLGRAHFVIGATRRTVRISTPPRQTPRPPESRPAPDRTVPASTERKILLGRYVGANPKNAPVDGRRVK